MYIRLSAGTAAKLGLKKFKFTIPMPTAYLMIGNRCLFNCFYCAQARESRADVSKLSRIVWPQYELKTVLEILENQKPFSRFCIQAVSGKKSKDETLVLIEKLSRFKIPISLSVRPRNMEEVRAYFSKGIERIGIAVDVISPELFKKYRGGSYEKHLGMLFEAAKEFEGRVTTHVIIGLGEKEKDVIDFIHRCYTQNIEVGLFSFTPVKGTALEKLPQPDIKKYRTVQVARYLLKKDLKCYEKFHYDKEGKLLDFGIDVSSVNLEKAYRTSGCPGCTRPFYNERPGKEIYNVFA
ncbi:hypothetical protein AT15_08290 [Kosmotoga arenicorallina S304]|uniref:Radical SAM core domain-containing protein n=1 Tax=Kosmotoga arenicorallina S304 TaxID=1453497 RepID=A0A176K1U5_9BACT|nr:radical SAM protein [Kosmotoga arenicorallina]OAA30969.1 hypothetical protein AT15_08290 [Kosmotoga arenicorallina S304]